MHPFLPHREEPASPLPPVKRVRAVAVKVPRALAPPSVSVLQVRAYVDELAKEHKVRLCDKKQLVMVRLQELRVQRPLVGHARLVLQLRGQEVGELMERPKKEPNLRAFRAVEVALWPCCEELSKRYD